MVKVAVLVSGGGTNLQALIDAQAAGKLGCGQISLVVSSNSKAYALTRAENAGIASAVVRRKDYANGEEYDLALAQTLKDNGIELVSLHDRPEMTVLGSYVYLIECANAGYAEFERLTVIEAFEYRYYGAFPVK